MTDRTKLFLGAFLQVGLVTSATYLISQRLYIAVFFNALALNFCWTYNVKRIAMSTLGDRLTYAFGAACGAVSGLYLSTILC